MPASEEIESSIMPRTQYRYESLLELRRGQERDRLVAALAELDAAPPIPGTGTKAGGADYLLHFFEPMVVTENTVRHSLAS